MIILQRPPFCLYGGIWKGSMWKKRRGFCRFSITKIASERTLPGHTAYSLLGQFVS